MTPELTIRKGDVPSGRMYRYQSIGIQGFARCTGGTRSLLLLTTFFLSLTGQPQLYGQETDVGEDTSREEPSDSGEEQALVAPNQSRLPFLGIFEGGREKDTGVAVPLVPGKFFPASVTQGLTVALGTSVVYNSNLYQDSRQEEGGSFSTADLGFSYRRGNELLLQPYIFLDYEMVYVHYWDEDLNKGREPLEHSFSGGIGIKGAKTALILTGAFSRDEGQQTNLAREESEDRGNRQTNYNVGLEVIRKLRRTSLHGNLSLHIQENGQGESNGQEVGEQLNDLRTVSGSLGWAISPLRMPEVEFRPTVLMEYVEQREGGEVESINPRLNVAYSYSPKTSFFAGLGADFRSGTFQVGEEGEEATYSQTNPTYELSANWQANSTSSLNASIYRRSTASALQGQSSSDRTGVSIGASKLWPRGFATSLYYSYETADYTDIRGTEREGDEAGAPAAAEGYHNAGLTLGRSFQLRPGIPLSASLYYQYSLRSGGRGGRETLSGAGTGGGSGESGGDIEQSIIGFRLGISF